MTAELTAAPRVAPASRTTATVEIVIPVLNEERALRGCITTLSAFLGDGFPFPWSITIADNGSTDRTWEIATELAERNPRISARRVPVRGRGAAIKATWGSSTADIVAYMDVDLSTGLESLLPLIAPLVSGHCEITIGTRLGRGSRIRRSLKREIVSRTYNAITRHVFGLRSTDTSAGFKAARREAVLGLLDAVEDDHWFFDTEMLMLAEHNGLRVHEVPLDWVEDVDSRVKVTQTAMGNLKGLVRVGRAIAAGKGRVDVPEIPQLRATHPDAVLAEPRAATLAKFLGFAVIGVISTVLYTLLYLPLRVPLTPAGANLVALVLVGVANTEANRRWTFNRGGGHRLGLHTRAAILFATTYLLTTLAVTGLHLIAPGSGPVVELLVLIVAYGLMTLLRFVALDRWVFARHRKERR
ncbi:glycosyltransferase [Amycolatopsis decaplanina]|uniref:Glycosyl transferase family protein n=1 Tax=Amycolatopsis decaplanina DSM 44594 TaxID=1284240 RepID=M2ZVF3_9PSEU|nr:glycosyltransferase [Amycolatopsis decaplanina]EME64708.1 glycosyl transferase family protein [Amycolatopsis decaplanina DSM 44594]